MKKLITYIIVIMIAQCVLPANLQALRPPNAKETVIWSVETQEEKIAVDKIFAVVKKVKQEKNRPIKILFVCNQGIIRSKKLADKLTECLQLLGMKYDFFVMNGPFQKSLLSPDTYDIIISAIDIPKGKEQSVEAIEEKFIFFTELDWEKFAHIRNNSPFGKEILAVDALAKRVIQERLVLILQLAVGNQGNCAAVLNIPQASAVFGANA